MENNEPELIFVLTARCSADLVVQTGVAVSFFPGRRGEGVKFALSCASGLSPV